LCFVERIFEEECKTKDQPLALGQWCLLAKKLIRTLKSFWNLLWIGRVCWACSMPDATACERV